MNWWETMTYREYLNRVPLNEPPHPNDPMAARVDAAVIVARVVAYPVRSMPRAAWKTYLDRLEGELNGYF